DLAQGVAYLTSGLKGFSSVGYSGTNNSPNNWANIYDQLLGTAGAYGVLGNCGALDQALTQVLGPDPMPCDQQTGQLVGTTVQPSGGPGGSSSSSSSSSASTAATPAATTAAAPNPLQQLLSPLLGG
ncbi:MAG TPA: hypothetical protein VMU09_09545, partial [Acidimicrobiales bacterium]|nr:hypothetical protein [Acidimicrobiales bacterium]